MSIVWHRVAVLTALVAVASALFVVASALFVAAPILAAHVALSDMVLAVVAAYLTPVHFYQPTFQPHKPALQTTRL